jgi:hypothetical protein
MFGNRKKYFIYALSMLLVVGFYGMSVTVSYAALKDSDADGIIDDAEMNTYRTDPQKNDTDGDGFDDGYEVVNQTNPLDAQSTSFITQKSSSFVMRIIRSISSMWLLGIFGGMMVTVLISSALLARSHTKTAQVPIVTPEPPRTLL